MNKKELLERINKDLETDYFDLWLDTKSNGTVVLCAAGHLKGFPFYDSIESFETKEDALRKYPFLKVTT